MKFLDFLINITVEEEKQRHLKSKQRLVQVDERNRKKSTEKEVGTKIVK